MLSIGSIGTCVPILILYTGISTNTNTNTKTITECTECVIIAEFFGEVV